MKCLRLAWRVLRSRPSDSQVNVVEAVLAEHGVIYGCRIDPNPEGDGFRFRSHNPQMLLVATCLFSEIPGVIARESLGQGGEFLFFTDPSEARRAAEDSQ